MNGTIATLATRYAGRPLLLTPRSAQELADRVQSVDQRAFARPGRLSALFKRLSLTSAARTPIMAMEDEDYTPPPPMEERLAYTPLFIGEAEDLGFCWALKDGIALMQCDTALVDRGTEFCGTVYHGYDTLLMAMREASADQRVKGIFLRMDSPGGVVAGGITELAAFMRGAREAAGGKPIWVYADMACSAAYWIAAQADQIWAPKVGLVGSIGAVIVHEDWSVALDKAGVKITAIQFGEHKTDGAWWDALAPGAKADLQAEIDQCGRNFIADVIAGRPDLTEKACLATGAAVYMAEHDEAARSGEALKLVDHIGGEEEAFEALKAHVAATQSAPVGSISPVAPGARAGGTKEQPMADHSAARKAAIAKAKAAVSTAEANLVKARAEVETAESETAEDEDEETDVEETPEPPAETDAEPEGDTEAEKISNSAEAKAEPAMAMAAISSKQTFAQFKASVKAATGRPAKGGALREALAGSQRLGADANGGGGKGGQPLPSAGATWAKNRAAGLKR